MKLETAKVVKITKNKETVMTALDFINTLIWGNKILSGRETLADRISYINRMNNITGNETRYKIIAE
jgi:hypothetical protein